jgi:hypothetical protein
LQSHVVPKSITIPNKPVRPNFVIFKMNEYMLYYFGLFFSFK